MPTVQEVHAYAVEMLVQHGLPDWKIRWNRSVRNAGETTSNNKTITLSAVAFEQWDWALVEELLIHEIAHALVGPRHQHDPRWRKMVHQLGGTPEENCPEFSGSALANPHNAYFLFLVVVAAWFVSPPMGLVLTGTAAFSAVVAIVRNARVLPTKEREEIERAVLNP